MARPFQGILTVTEFIPTGEPGEYGFYGASFQSETDPTSSGAYAVTPGMVLYVQAMAVETAEPLPGVAHRFLLTSATAFSESLLDGVILWDEDGDEVDAPLNRSTGLLSEVTLNRGFGQPAAPGIYEQVPAGMWEAALMADQRRIADHGGEGGGDVYTNTNPTPSSLGGIPAGATFSSKSMGDMWDALLYPYQAPAFTAFAITGQGQMLEVGDSTTANPAFTWSISNSGNVGSNNIGIADTTAAESLVSGHANSGSVTVTHAGVTKSAPGSEVYTISGTNSHSAGFSRTFTISWRWRVFFGESATTPLADTDIQALRSSALQAGFAGVYAFVAASAEYEYLAYPASLGTASSFKDQSTNLDVPFESAYTVSVTNAFGATTLYNVHRSSNAIGSAISIVVS